VSKPAAQQMQCMEVWGGSQLMGQGVEFGGLDAWVYSKPYAEAQNGGDVYYASSCATGRITRLLVADVSGHGNAVAATASELRTLMRRFVNRLDQTEFVRLLNEQFAELSQDGTYATAVVTTFFAPSRRLTICNAGHPRPFFYSARRRDWSLLRHGKTTPGRAGNILSNTPLGMIALAEYEQFDVELEHGDCLLCYTDALIESNDTDGQMLGEDGLLKIIRSLFGAGIDEADGPQQIAEKLLKEIAARYPDNLTDDDVTLLVARGTARSLKYSLAEKARAFGRFAGAMVRSFRPNAEPVPFPDARLANLGGAIIPALARRWRAKGST
jgi:sigma-B regulation protein RsbU (phosphoserine phosphatase)